MAENELDGYGPVDYLVVEFPAGTSNFTGEIAEEIVRLVDAGTIQVIDMIVIAKEADGSIDAMEISDTEDLGPLTQIEAGLAGLLADDDVAILAAEMSPRKRGRGAGLQEPLGRTVRSRSPTRGRSAHRRWAHLARGRRRRAGGGADRCRGGVRRGARGRRRRQVTCRDLLSRSRGMGSAGHVQPAGAQARARPEVEGDR